MISFIRYPCEIRERLKVVKESSVRKSKYWLVSVSMGYGHLRAVYPLRSNSEKGVIRADKLPESGKFEKLKWKFITSLYETVSRAGEKPVIGLIFRKLLNYFLYIPDNNYQGKKVPFQVRWLENAVKNGLGEGFVQHISYPHLPVVTSFYAVAIAAERAGYQNVCCIICDTDLSRAWVPADSSRSRINYFVPEVNSATRLISYGVDKERIKITGFPLPLELLGDRDLTTLKMNLWRRLMHLDPQRAFFSKHETEVNNALKLNILSEKKNSSNDYCLTILYAVGGAGAQKKIGGDILKSLAVRIHQNNLRLIFAAGTRKDTRDYLMKIKNKILPWNNNVEVLWAKDFESYYYLFNNALQETDILWTKPSELVFYSALGIPIIMTKPLGPQELANHNWLKNSGAGMEHPDPSFFNIWLTYQLNNGRLAEAAWNGFIKSIKFGTFNIMDQMENILKENDPSSLNIVRNIRDESNRRVRKFVL